MTRKSSQQLTIPHDPAIGCFCDFEVFRPICQIVAVEANGELKHRPGYQNMKLIKLDQHQLSSQGSIPHHCIQSGIRGGIKGWGT